MEDDSVIIVTCNSEMCMGGKFLSKGCQRFGGKESRIRSIFLISMFGCHVIFPKVSKEESIFNSLIVLIMYVFSVASKKSCVTSLNVYKVYKRVCTPKFLICYKINFCFLFIFELYLI